MPTYLCHGFRWQRRSIQVYVVVQDLDDASPAWIIPAKSAQCLLDSFYTLFDFLPYCSRSSYAASSDSPARSGLLPVASRDSDNDSGTTAAAAAAAADDDDDDDDDDKRARGPPPDSSCSSRGRSRGRSLSRQLSGSEAPRGKGKASEAQPWRRRRQTSNSVVGAGEAQQLPHDDMRAQDWSVVKLLEEYDPGDLSEVSRPYAYVADFVVRIDLSASVAEEMRQYEERARADPYPPVAVAAEDGSGSGSGWFEQLRDQLQHDESIRWYVVVNGDEVRDFPDESEAEPLPLRQQRTAPQHPVALPLGTRATRQQQAHHREYVLQQLAFEADDQKQQQGPTSATTTTTTTTTMTTTTLLSPPGQQQPPGGNERAASQPPPCPPRRNKMLDRGHLPAVVSLTRPSGRKNKKAVDEVGPRPKTASGAGGGLRRLFGRSGKTALDCRD